MLIILLALLNGSSPSLLQDSNLQRELAGLSQRGLTYRFLDDETAEIREEWSGYSRIKTLQEPSETAIRAWADTHGVPILEINPAMIDTSRYAGWYRYWAQVPLSNGIGGSLVVGDVNNDHLTEVYGAYRDFGTPVAFRIYGVDTSGQAALLHDYGLNGGISTRLLDADANGLSELADQRGDTMFFFEQPNVSSLPTIRKFIHIMFQYPGTAIWTRVQFGNLDNDTCMDFLFRGTTPDSTPSRWHYGTYVAEYNNIVNNFQRVWSADFPPWGSSAIGGYITGDFDSDGKVEFIASGISGGVYLMENMAENQYGEVWRDSLPFVNMYYQTSGDVDNDGKKEFFVGATMSNGNWTTMYETDSDNHYSPKFIFHLISGGTLDEPTYLTTDVDGDGRLELVICSGVDLYIFKSRNDNSYYLWYYKRENARDGVQFYDFDNDGKKDFIVNKTFSNGQSLRFQADIYRAANVVSVRGDSEPIPLWITLLENYPNPFNSSTTITYRVEQFADIHLAVFDLLGREIALLAGGIHAPGEYTVQWDANIYSSGIYLCNLRSRNHNITTKLLFLR